MSNKLKIKSPEIAKIAKIARGQGWEVRRTNNSHLQFVPPNGEDIIVCGQNSTDWRALRNFKASLIAAGLTFANGKSAGQQSPAKTLIEIAELLGVSPEDAAASLEFSSDREIDDTIAVLKCAGSEQGFDKKCLCGTEHAHVLGAFRHQRKCPESMFNRPDPEKESNETMKRNMENPPERERLNCSECPDWFWVSQPHLLQQHMATEHGKQPCPWCQVYYSIARGGLVRHVNKCSKSPERLTGAELVSLPGARQVIPTRRDPDVVSDDDRIENRATDAAFTGDSGDDNGQGGMTTPAELPAPAPAPVAQAAKPISKPTPTRSKPEPPAIVRSSTASDDELWTLLEIVLDGPVRVTRESMKAINAWLDATRELYRAKEQG